MGQLSEKAAERVAGASWDGLRRQFHAISESLLSVSPEARGALTTIYVKFTITPDPNSPVYAVIWAKNSKQLVVGLRLPEDEIPPGLHAAPAGTTYKGLSGYFKIQPGDMVPQELPTWAQAAYASAARSS